MLKYLSVLALLLLPNSAIAALKIATWNLEHLTEKNEQGCKPRTDADYFTLKNYADSLNADVIAFQEVENREAAERVFDPHLYNIEISGRPYRTTRVECWYRPGHFLSHHRVGFAIKKHVPYRRLEDFKKLGVSGTRWGVEIVVYPETKPTHFLSIHLKSGCFAGPLTRDESACQILSMQLPILEEWIDNRAEEGKRFAILGDFNRRLNIAGDEFWLEIDDSLPNLGADLEKAGAGKINMVNGKYCVKEEWAEFIDHIVTSRDVDLMIREFTFRVYLYEETKDQLPSDHCAVSVDLELDG